MVVQPLGTEYSVQGPRLVMENRGPSPSKEILPGTNSSPPIICQGPAIQICHKENKEHQIPGASVLCSEKGLRSKESYSGLVCSKQSSSLRQVPDANYCAGTDPTTPWGRHLLYRSYRRLLAYSDCPSPYPLPWLQAGQASLCLQSYAIRNEHSSKDIYKADRHGHSSTEKPGDISSSISGRLDSMGIINSGMQESSQEGNSLSTISRLSNKQKKVPLASSGDIRMAGPQMGPSISYSLSHPEQKEVHSQANETVHQEPDGLEESSRESIRVPSVCLSDGLPSKSQVEGHQQGLEEKSIRQAPGSTFSNAYGSQKETQTLDNIQEPLKIGPTDISSTVLNSSHRRVTEWLGWPSSFTNSSGNVVTPLPVLSHQCSGSHGSLSSSEEAQTRQTLSYSTSSGQPSNCSLYKQRRLEDQEYQSSHDSHLPASKEKKLASISLPPRRGQKRGRGFALKNRSSGVGMVSRQSLISMDSRNSSRSSSRPVRDRIQSQAPMLRSSKSGPPSVRDRRPVSRLEPMVKHLPIPTNKLFAESSAQTENLQGEGSLNSPGMAQKQLVSSSYRTETQSIPDPESNTRTDSTNEDCIRFILANKSIGFMDFMKFAANKRFLIEPDNISFTESDKSESTIRQYDSAFRKLSTFIHKEQLSKMSINAALSFFRSLHQSGLASATIATIKSALVKIFAYGFGINLNDLCFSSIYKACAKQRPSIRPNMLSWSLNKVLRLASGIHNENCSYQLLLRKTLFLTALASGARVSELAALSREKGFIKFLPSGEVSLAPHPKFLAKNEDPANRWKPWRIVPLPQDPSLCPVKSLKAFLEKTENRKVGRLFQRESGGTLTIDGIKQQILYLIKEADPESIPKAHDVRAVATSINYFHFMDFQALTEFTGWKSMGVFVKHYFKNLEALRFHTVAAGRVVPPGGVASRESEPDT